MITLVSALAAPAGNTDLMELDGWVRVVGIVVGLGLIVGMVGKLVFKSRTEQAAEAGRQADADALRARTATDPETPAPRSSSEPAPGSTLDRDSHERIDPEEPSGPTNSGGPGADRH